MSPEQVRAVPTDARSDIFSAGVVLFEMIAGARPFQGASAVETMNAILKEDPPDFATLRPSLPAAVTRIVRHCLEKSAADRFQSARDLAFALEALSGSDIGATRPAAVVAGSARLRRLAPWVVAAAATLLCVASVPLAVAFLRRPAPDQPVVVFPIKLPANTTFGVNVDMSGLAVSPDGRRIVFVAASKGVRSLWVRSLSTPDPEPIAGTEGAVSPFWSPDSRSIAFFAGGKLRRTEADGESPRTICDVPPSIETTGTWGRDNVILYTDRRKVGRGFFRVPASGGAPLPIGQDTEVSAHWVQFLPDGRHYVFDSRATRAGAAHGIFVGSLDEPGARLVLPNINSRIAYAGRYLVYVDEGRLLGQPFDLDALRVSGEVVTIVEHLPYFDQTGWSEFSVSDTGVLAYMGDVTKLRMVWLDRAGRETGQVTDPGWFDGVRLSRDSSRLAYTSSDPHSISGDIWVQDLGRGTKTRITAEASDENDSVWSPDGRRIAFFSCCGDKGPQEATTLHIKTIGEAGLGTRPVEIGFDQPSDWSSDGKMILFSRNTPGTTRNQIWILPIGTGGKAYPFRENRFSEQNGRFSTDGKWVAFVSDESGGKQVYVARTDPPGADVQLVSAGIGRSPSWRDDDKELIFLGAEGTIMSVKVTAGRTLIYPRPRCCFTTS